MDSTTVSFAVPGTSTSGNHPSKKRRADNEEVKKPQIKVENWPLYRIARNHLTKKIKWQEYVLHLEKYVSLNMLPSYCKINRSCPQMWEHVEEMSTWWSSKMKQTEKDLFSHLLSEARRKEQAYTTAEMEHMVTCSNTYSPIELEEHRRALQTLETRVRAMTKDNYQNTLVRDMAGTTARPRGRSQQRPQALRNTARKEAQKRKRSSSRSKQRGKRAAPQKAEYEPNDQKMIDVIMAAIKQAKGSR